MHCVRCAMKEAPKTEENFSPNPTQPTPGAPVDALVVLEKEKEKEKEEVVAGSGPEAIAEETRATSAPEPVVATTTLAVEVAGPGTAAGAAAVTGKDKSPPLEISTDAAALHHNASGTMSSSFMLASNSTLAASFFTSDNFLDSESLDQAEVVRVKDEASPPGRFIGSPKKEGPVKTFLRRLFPGAFGAFKKSIQLDEDAADDDGEPTWIINEGTLDGTRGCDAFSEQLVSKMRYWVVHTSFIIVEPIICSYAPKNDLSSASYFRSWSWTLQVILLVLSSLLLWVQVDVCFQRALRASTGEVGVKRVATFVSLVLSYVEIKGVVIEILCLLCGWVFIWFRPGIAILRCFRVLRILFYNDLPSHPKRLILKSFSVFLGVFTLEIFVKNSQLVQAKKLAKLYFKLMKFISFTMEHLGQEMFFVSKKTRGGFALMVMLFYSIFVLGLVSWIDVASMNLSDADGTLLCDKSSTCLSSVLRLTLWDDTGLNFLSSLAKSNKFLFAIIVVFLCATSFGILNGLTGIFRFISNRTSKLAFVRGSREKEKRDRLEMIMLSKRQMLIKEITEQLPLLKSKLQTLQQNLAELEQKKASSRAPTSTVSTMFANMFNGVVQSLAPTPPAPPAIAST